MSEAIYHAAKAGCKPEVVKAAVSGESSAGRDQGAEWGHVKDGAP